MDDTGLTGKIRKLVIKNRFVLLVLGLGLLLMLIPGKKQASEETVVPVKEPEKESLQTQLEEILMHLQGAGQVRLLLTSASGEEKVYQTNENRSDGDGTGNLRIETVLVTDANRAQNALITRIDPPVYLGAVVLCQGAENPAVKLAVVEAVSNATGLSSDKIAVLKMK